MKDRTIVLIKIKKFRKKDKARVLIINFLTQFQNLNSFTKHRQIRLSLAKKESFN